MKNLKISKFYKPILLVFSAVLAVLFIVILIKGLNYDVILKGGTNLVYKVNSKDINSFYNSIDHLSEKELFRIEKSTLKNFSTVSITISKDLISKDDLEKSFSNIDHHLISEEIYSSRIGRQFSLKFLIILISFSILIVISSAIIYRDVGGFKVGISLTITLFSNILLQLGIFSLTNLPLGRSFFSYTIFSTIVICYNYLSILTRSIEIEKSAPIGKLSAKVLIDKSMSDTFATITFSFVAIIIVSLIIFVISYFLNGMSLKNMMHQSVSVFLAYINSILLLPSLLYSLNKDKEF